MMNLFQRRYSKKIGDTWPRITMQLRNYTRGYKPKQAKAFTKDQVIRALQLGPGEDYPHEWIMKKAIISINFNGGIRGCELRSLNFGSLEPTDEGIWTHFEHGKQQTVQENRFLIPVNKERPDLCFATPVIEYLNLLRDCHPDIKSDDPLFYRALKAGTFSKKKLGQHKLANLGTCLCKTGN